MAENDTVHRSPPPARRRAGPPRLGRGGHTKATAVGPRQPPPQPHPGVPPPPPRRPPRPPRARLCLFARCAPRAPHTRSPAREGEPAQVSGSEPSHPPKHTPSPPPPLLAIPHVGRRRRGREPPAAASPRSRFFGIDSSLRWRRATVGAGWGAPGAAGGGLAGGGASPRLRRRVLAAGTGWVAPRGAETPLPSREHVHARAHARTVTFKYNCVTVGCPRVYIKLSIAISIVLDSRDSLGCPPPPRKGSRVRVRRPPVLAILHGHAQVPDLTVDCNVRARRRRRRRLSGGATQTGRSGSRTGLICPSPARMAARQPSDPDGTLPTGAQRDRYTWVG
jgi:hypothetical protein